MAWRSVKQGKRRPGISCAGSREAVREALTGGSAGQVLSSEITSPGCRPCRTVGKATQYRALVSKSFTGPAESETLGMRGHSMHENREISAMPTMGGGTGREGLWP